ncbi:MAG: hypothetical protein IPI73_24435 [Betaproteobacteria bacterium]|nr:hypothetical protein [Betaproteobacteria bacterium]
MQAELRHPLPWTSPPTASLWDWFTLQANIDGIAFSYSTGGGNSSCCNPRQRDQHRRR